MKDALSRPSSQVGFEERERDSIPQLDPCSGFLPPTVWAHPFGAAGAASCLAQHPLSISAWIPTVLLSSADYKPQGSPGALPDLPAYVLFLCFRHADHCSDEPRARSLLDAAIDAIKRVMKVLGLGVWAGLRSRSCTGQSGGGTGPAAPRTQHVPDHSVQPEHLLV